MSSTLNFSSRLSYVLGRFVQRHAKRHSREPLRRQFSGHNSTADPLPIFLDRKVQNILKKITGFDLMKISSQTAVSMEKDEYKLLTDKELKQEYARAVHKANLRLQMPPVMSARQEEGEIITKTPEIDGLETHPTMFVDITYGIPNRKRTSVVRCPDGTLRRTTWQEKDRVNQIFFPVEGRKIITPNLFKESNVEDLLHRDKFVYLLDMTCVQFEPDNPEYTRVTHRTYEHINSTKKFDSLSSTRHFGPMAFHLVWYNNMENLLADMIQRDLIEDAADLVRLHHYIHQTTDATESTDDIELIKDYFKSAKGNTAEVELAIQTYEDEMRVNSKLESGS